MVVDSIQAQKQGKLDSSLLFYYKELESNYTAF